MGGSGHGRLAVHRGDGRHPLLVGLLALATPDHAQRAFGLDHRDALAIDRADEDLAAARFHRGLGALGVERVEVNGGLAHELLGRALGHAHPGHLADQRDRLVKRPADHAADQPPLALIAVDPLRQAQLDIKRMQRLMSGSAVADARDPQLAEQGQHRAGVGPLVGQAQRPPVMRIGGEDDRRAEITVAAGVHMCLQLQARELPGAAL